MIQAEHLRINNWLHLNFGIPVQIVGLQRLDNQVLPVISDGVKEFIVSLSVLSPIALSPDILEKCGFEKETPDNKHGEVYKKKNFKFIVRGVNFGVYPKTERGYAFELDDKDAWETIVSKIEYLHQLQNLYHALTGNELIYKP